jgi:CRP/FNR family transcriptional regulator
VAFMEGFKTGELHVAAGTAFLPEGAASQQLFTVLRGQGLRYKTLPDGRRQVLSFLLPGDFTGLQAGLLGEMRHTAEAVTPMVLCAFGRARVWDLFRTAPERAYDLTWIAAVEEHFLGETIATLGQRDATERMSWALVRIWRRLSAVGLREGDTVPLPFRQHDMADALGLSLVHTNRVVSALRRSGLATWAGGRLTMHDHAKLSALAGLAVEAEERRPLM